MVSARDCVNLVGRPAIYEYCSTGIGVGSEVEKATFLEVAPQYYALAIALRMSQAGDPLYQQEIVDEYTIGTSNGTYTLLQNSFLFERAIAWLAQREIIDVVDDPFAPTFYLAGPKFSEWTAWKNDRSLPFRAIFQRVMTAAG